jgi:hypothetical protein
MTVDEASTEARDSELAEAAASGRALVAHCSSCEYSFWHPRGHCPRCGSRRVALVDAGGSARVYTATTNHRPRGGGTEPVHLGYVEFPDGVRMLVNLRFPDGAPVIGAEVTPDREGDGETVRLVFRPVE